MFCATLRMFHGRRLLKVQGNLLLWECLSLFLCRSADEGRGGGDLAGAVPSRRQQEVIVLRLCPVGKEGQGKLERKVPAAGIVSGA